MPTSSPDIAHDEARARTVSSSGDLVPFPMAHCDAHLVQGLRAGRKDAAVILFDRYAPVVHRVLMRVLGPDQELEDLLHEVFLIALRSSAKLEKPDSLRSWLAGIAVNTARSRIRKRVRWRFLRFVPTEELPDVGTFPPDLELSAAVVSTYEVLEQMNVDERIAFSLRFIDGMELTEVANTCGVSLATIKRRLKRASENFRVLAEKNPELEEWLSEGARWRS